MYIAPTFYRPEKGPEFIDHNRERAKSLDRERREFIRTAAVAFSCVRDTGPVAHERTGRSCLLATSGEAWSLARELWEARPDDC